MLNEYKFNFQHDSDSKTILQQIYCTKSAETNSPQVITIEYFPETWLQAKSVEVLSEMMVKQIGKTARVDYIVSICIMADDNKQFILSTASSFDGEYKIKAFEVIRIRGNNEVQFKETDRFNGEYLNITYIDPDEQKKKLEFDAKKREMQGA
jgi:hypothetical protein